jgi:hypothetical protein
MLMIIQMSQMIILLIISKIVWNEKTKSNISYTKKQLGNKCIILKLNCSLIFLLNLGNDML